MNATNLSVSGASLSRLDEVPHLNCGMYPTPLEELTRLRTLLGGGPRIFIKRDDYTGIGFGGNKVRKLEYVLAQAVAGGADVAITIGGEKSNHARMTAALCARLGIHCVLVLNPATPGTVPPNLKPASRFIYESLGAETHAVSDRAAREGTARAIAETLRHEGKRVFEVPLGGSVPVGALGFVRAMQETASQFEDQGVRPNYIFHASTSGGTQAGLIVGCQLAGYEKTCVVGVSPDDPSGVIATTVAEIVNGTYGLLELDDQLKHEDIVVLDEYIGPGFGLETPASVEAFRLVARNEGILLDPVYTAKTMAALIDWIRKEKLSELDTVLFWHTGGQLAMFYTPI